MPKCVRCAGHYPPQLCEVLDKDDHMCIFCRQDKNEIKVDKPGELSYMYTKKEAQRDYQKYLRKLSETKRVEEIIEKGKGKGII